MSSVAHSPNGQRAHSERPERSRNAKAQARHRAKRKAYIEQLEQTVTKLQTVLGYTPEQVAALPPPLVKIRELEQENGRLLRENEELRRVLADPTTRTQNAVELNRRDPLSFHDGRACDRDFKRRKINGSMEEVYMTPSETPPHTADVLTRPPPLTIPQPLSHQYNSLNSGSQSGAASSSSLYSLHAPAFQMPNTPSGSSSTSSPPFSQPAHMHPPQQQSHSSHSPVNHRPSATAISTQHQHHLSNFSHSANHYGPVKVEDENFTSSSHHTSHSNHYTLPPFAPAQEHELDTWHAYSSERAPLHR